MNRFEVNIRFSNRDRDVCYTMQALGVEDAVQAIRAELASGWLDVPIDGGRSLVPVPGAVGVTVLAVEEGSE